MRAVEFAKACREAGYMLGHEAEPEVFVRLGRSGPEIPVGAVKVSSGKIIIEGKLDA